MTPFLKGHGDSRYTKHVRGTGQWIYHHKHPRSGPNKCVQMYPERTAESAVVPLFVWDILYRKGLL